MPTKRRRRERFRRPDVDPYHWALLTDSPIPEDANPYAEFDFKPEVLWPKYREQILNEWVKNYPGTRPSHWWLFDAPRKNDPGNLAGHYILKFMCEPRRLLKGMGQPIWEVAHCGGEMYLGIPCEWTGGDPERLVFESQHAYLSRFCLLEPGEGRSPEPEFTPRLYR